MAQNSFSMDWFLSSDSVLERSSRTSDGLNELNFSAQFAAMSSWHCPPQRETAGFVKSAEWNQEFFDSKQCNLSRSNGLINRSVHMRAGRLMNSCLNLEPCLFCGFFLKEVLSETPRVVLLLANDSRAFTLDLHLQILKLNFYKFVSEFKWFRRFKWLDFSFLLLLRS